MKYYFITYQGTNRDGTDSVWNEVINESPMSFIKDVSEVEEAGSGSYRSFVVINTCEISEDEFKQYKDEF